MTTVNLTMEQTVLVAFGLILFILAIAVMMQQSRINKLLKGKSAATLEDSFKNIEKEYLEVKKWKNSVNVYLDDVEKRLGKSIQAVTTLRFNPWKGNGEGGNQSFASAFLSQKGDGLILSSLNVRDRISIFAKPVKKGKSGYELTHEESEVLNKAFASVKSDAK
ncbi:MAG: hypothetical protein A3H57_02295 [Candidatus Taylorbacteria bacterium RIFCSPLOWO2_02_FULL_43_11]|uniref:DUF4446 domain-containing protein n=1 Tax=Candidatus Taylorbacteria bacterium RIFCSPHIGHO2_02_FULL_43_32b TaxID=1802306 RepID=A0A1G2MKD5_9BACT|nr:MAG: hypothetical protein A2743_02015 [Candidatus Taylorbacteria bacterium RIFCSPHIGHO2_01_FULL_43_47]OHA24326.1 MAG: hypothetical protein A3C72_03440 [Candidatus Taylorbacteria bacterium RIFCSPHIGHO2_02_FULL_43_32b]OHA31369.1 MAG: hypothetical protein A3B08_00370 [Candidatus Taylorbacteria bacterium RIFCSPLOWO2_01_FULL_43_44]OHA37735.1 MAG: hypothetical protein A3H57_02295 [Candidatus Taylorbacteria bacterium RIFCSPLOWO2_02_FULL_43_11]